MENFNQIFSDLFSDIQLLKQRVNIGIFGSFEEDGGRLEKLIQLKEFLTANGYYVKISKDLEPHFPKLSSDTPITYNKRMSDELIRTSHIYIFVFFFERDGEHNINQSACLELCKIGDSDVLILFESGSFDQQRSMFLAEFEGKSFSWSRYDWIDFKEVKVRCLMYCLEKSKNIF